MRFLQNNFHFTYKVMAVDTLDCHKVFDNSHIELDSVQQIFPFQQLFQHFLLIHELSRVLQLALHWHDLQTIEVRHLTED